MRISDWSSDVCSSDLAMRHHESVLALGRDGRGAERFTTRSMMSAEEALVRAAGRLANARQHAVSMNDMGRAVAAAEARGLRLSGEQRNALEHVIRRPRLSLVVGLAGNGKSAMVRSEGHTSEL